MVGRYRGCESHAPSVWDPSTASSPDPAEPAPLGGGVSCQRRYRRGLHSRLRARLSGLSGESSSLDSVDGGVGGGEAEGESGGILKRSQRTVMVIGYLSVPRMEAPSSGSGTVRILDAGISSGPVVQAVSLNTDRSRRASVSRWILSREQ